jgi:hypothetical protein
MARRAKAARKRSGRTPANSKGVTKAAMKTETAKSTSVFDDLSKLEGKAEVVELVKKMADAGSLKRTDELREKIRKLVARRRKIPRRTKTLVRARKSPTSCSIAIPINIARSRHTNVSATGKARLRVEDFLVKIDDPEADGGSISVLDLFQGVAVYRPTLLRSALSRFEMTGKTYWEVESNAK